MVGRSGKNFYIRSTKQLRNLNYAETHFCIGRQGPEADPAGADRLSYYGEKLHPHLPD